MKVLLEAPILTQSGYGEHSRLVFRALLDRGVEIYTNPLNWGQTSWLTSFGEEREKIEKSINDFYHAKELLSSGKPFGFDIHIHVGIPNEFEKKAPYSICVTAGIETDRVSVDWIVKTNEQIDKLIVPSEHSKYSFTRTAYEAIDKKRGTKEILECACPVEVVPYPVKEISPSHLDFKLDTKFNFLSVALLGHRKNMHNMINWFMEEFRDEEVGLLIKTSSSSGSIMDRKYTTDVLKDIVSRHKEPRKCKVYLLHGDISEKELHSLYVREDIHAYVTTTHGEGYGLPLFEAAYSGLPIVATDWSGHLDFLTAEVREKKKTKIKKMFAHVEYDLGEISREVVWKDILIEGAEWAYPREESYKKQIRSMHDNYSFHLSRAQTLKNKILDNFSKKEVFKRMQEAIFTREAKEKKEEVLVM